MTKQEYNRRFNMILQAYHAGFLTEDEARAAIREVNHG